MSRPKPPMQKLCTTKKRRLCTIFPLQANRDFHHSDAVHALQTLGVVRVADDTAVRGLAGGEAVEADATALRPVLSTRGRDGGGAGDRLGGGAHRGGAGLHRGGGAGLHRGGGAGANSRGRVAGDRVAGVDVDKAGNGRVDGTEADVGEGNVGVGDLGLKVRRLARRSRAGTALLAGLGAVDGEGGVEPEHVGVMVIPDGHDKDHGLREGLAHLGHAALAVEAVVGVFEGSSASLAPLLSDRVSDNTGNPRLRVRDNDAVLHVEALDLGESAGRVLEELGHDGHLLGSIDRLANAVELLVAHAVRVEVATIGIAHTGIPVIAVGATAVVALAAGLVDFLARMGSIGSGHVVGLPNIHLGAARAITTGAAVGVIAAIGCPSLDVGLAIDELDVLGALRIAVAGTVLGTSLVARVLGKTTIQVHGNEVKSAIETAANVGHIDVKGKLVAEKFEGYANMLVLPLLTFTLPMTYTGTCRRS